MAFVKFWADASTNFDASKAQSDTLYFLTDTGKLYKGNTLIADKTPDSLPNAHGFNLYAQNDAQGNPVLVGTYNGSSTVNLKAGAFVQLVKNSDGTITIESQNTTYNADKGIKLNGTTFEHTNAITAGKTNAATGTLSHGGKFKVPVINYDAQGHLTSVSEAEYTLPSDQNTLGKNIVGNAATSTTDAAVTSNGVYLNHIEGSTVKSKHKISGDGTVVKVTSDSSGNITITGTDTNTHYATGITAGEASATVNSTTEVTDPYINIKDDSTHRGGVRLKGSGATSVKAVNGAITISSTNTWNANTGTQAGFVASPGNAKNKVWGTGSSGTPAWVDFSAAALGLGNAVHFLGTSSTEITDGGTQTPTIDSATVTPKAGDVVLYGNQEFIYNASNKWELFGDEGSYAVKTRNISTGTGLTGGGNLTADRTLSVKVGSTNKLGAAGAAGTTTNTTKVYAVQEDSAGNLAVYVPWTDTNTKVQHKARGTTKSYILGTSTAPTSSNVAVTALSETGIYIETDNSTSTIVAPRFEGAFVGNVTGNVSGSSGSCTGNAATATKATKDGDGNTITSTYATQSTVNTVSGNVTSLQTTLTWQSGAM